MSEPPAYGQTRAVRADVTYAQIERAATDILKTGKRPTVAGLHQALGGGSNRTLLDGLNRYWKDLGNQIAGNPDTLRRLPAAVADLAEGLWERALATATEAVAASQGADEARLARLKGQLEVREHTLSRREIELDELLRARERTVRELEEHLRAAMTLLSRRDVTLKSLETRLSQAQQEAEAYQQRLAGFLASAVRRQQQATPRPPTRAKKIPKPSRRPNPKRPAHKAPSRKPRRK